MEGNWLWTIVDSHDLETGDGGGEFPWRLARHIIDGGCFDKMYPGDDGVVITMETLVDWHLFEGVGTSVERVELSRCGFFDHLGRGRRIFICDTDRGGSPLHAELKSGEQWVETRNGRRAVVWGTTPDSAESEAHPPVRPGRDQIRGVHDHPHRGWQSNGG